jgi:hypothetical protein
MRLAPGIVNRSVIVGMLAGTFLALSSGAWAAGPGAPARAIPFRGHLDQDGEPKSGPVTMVVTVHDDPVAGTALYTQSTAVDVWRGDFSILLGAPPAPALPETVFDAAQLYLSITVDGVALLGRQQVVPAVQAVSAGQARDMVIDNQLTLGTPGGNHMALSVNGISGNNGYNNLTIQPSPGGGVYMNYYWGDSVQFCNGAQSCPTRFTKSGDLDMNGNTISGTSYGAFHIDPNGVSLNAVYLNWHRGDRVIVGNGGGAAAVTMDKSGNITATGTVAASGNVNAAGTMGLGYQVVECADGTKQCSCPAGTRVISGGAACWPNGGLLARSSPYSNGLGWNVECCRDFYCTTPTLPTDVRIICARIGP